MAGLNSDCGLEMQPNTVKQVPLTLYVAVQL